MESAFKDKRGNPIGGTWSSCAKDALQYFIHSLPLQERELLDYSLNSLKFVESWLLNRYSTRDGVLVEADTQILDGVLIYVGQTFQKNLDGYWKVNLSEFDPNEPFPFGEVEIVVSRNRDDGEEDGIRIQDHIIETVRKQSGTLLSDTLEAFMLDLDK